MGDFLLLGVRHRPDVEPQHHGPLATAALDEGPALADAARAALADTAWRGVGRGRNSLVLRLWDGRAVHRLIEGAGQVGLQEPVPHLFREVWRLDSHALTAAQALAALCDLIAADPDADPDADPAVGPEEFLRRLGDQAAGIRPGASGWLDLARAGRNRIPGDGFQASYDDGSHRQVRHFAGTVAAAARLGTRGARAAMLLRGDLPGSADGRLSLRAIDFTAAVLAGRLDPRDAGDWVRRHLLARTTGEGDHRPDKMGT